MYLKETKSFFSLSLLWKCFTYGMSVKLMDQGLDPACKARLCSLWGWQRSWSSGPEQAGRSCCQNLGHRAWRCMSLRGGRRMSSSCINPCPYSLPCCLPCHHIWIKTARNPAVPMCSAKICPKGKSECDTLGHCLDGCHKYEEGQDLQVRFSKVPKWLELKSHPISYPVF